MLQFNTLIDFIYQRHAPNSPEPHWLSTHHRHGQQQSSFDLLSSLCTNKQPKPSKTHVKSGIWKGCRVASAVDGLLFSTLNADILGATFGHTFKGSPSGRAARQDWFLIWHWHTFTIMTCVHCTCLVVAWWRPIGWSISLLQRILKKDQCKCIYMKLHLFQYLLFAWFQCLLFML